MSNEMIVQKTHKYKRFAHEKRMPAMGVKRIQTPHVMVTKWDVEISNTRNKKIGRKRDRDDKYGEWSENQTDTTWEDAKNKLQRELTKGRVTELRNKTRKDSIQMRLAEYKGQLFPRNPQPNTWYDRGIPASAWEAYFEYLEEIEEPEPAEYDYMVLPPANDDTYEYVLQRNADCEYEESIDEE